MNIKITPEKKSAFLTKLSTTGSVRLACEAAGICRATAYIWREQDEEFAKAWLKARFYGAEALEDEAIRRATGYEEKVYYRGEVVDTITKYSDRMLTTLLQAHFPLKYHMAKHKRDDTYMLRENERETKSVSLKESLKDTEALKANETDDDDLA